MYPPFGGTGPYGTYGNLGLYGALVAYGSIDLTETSPPQSFNEPLTLDEMYSYLKIPVSDPNIDDLLNSFISAAREQAEIAQNRDLVRKQWDLHLDYWPSYRIEMRDPLASVDLVQYRDSNGNYTPLVEDTDYIVDRAKHPGLIAPPYNATWPTYTPWPSSSLLVRFTSGFAPDAAFWNDAGHRVKTGMRRLISDWYFNRIPFGKGAAAIDEYPFGVSACLSFGALTRVK